MDIEALLGKGGKGGGLGGMPGGMMGGKGGGGGPTHDVEAVVADQKIVDNLYKVPPPYPPLGWLP